MSDQPKKKRKKVVLKLLPEKIRAKYRGKKVDLNADADRPAKKAGKRISAEGNVYYENRPNRSDIQKGKYPKLEHGGGIDNENLEMVKNQNKAIKHHTEELRKIVSRRKHVPAWVVAKIERAETDISDATHYLDGEEEYEHGGYMAKGGGVGDIAYSEIYEVLKEKLEDAADRGNINYEGISYHKGEEINHESRSAFIPWTNGGYEVSWYEYISSLNGSGTKLPTAPLDKKMERKVENSYSEAKDRFKEEYHEIVSELGDDNIDYHSLYEAGYESEAEQLSEWEMDMGDDSILMSIKAYYFTPNNSLGEDGKHTIILVGDVNLEAPYHRQGILDDFKEVTFTFDSIDDLKEKMDKHLETIIDWFGGSDYDTSKTEMRITRMKTGGKIGGSKRQLKGEGGYMAKGGRIKNQYLHKTSHQVWDEWTIKQREHFLNDHFEEWDETLVNDEWYHLPMEVQIAIDIHIYEGEYKEGGVTGENEYNKGDEGVFKGDDVVVLRYKNGLYSIANVDEDGDIALFDAEIRDINRSEFEEYFRLYPKLEHGGYMAKGGNIDNGSGVGEDVNANFKSIKNKKYLIQDRVAGNVIDNGMTMTEALSRLSEYEETDKKEGCYTANFYEIKEEVPTETGILYTIPEAKTGITYTVSTKTGIRKIIGTKEECEEYIKKSGRKDLVIVKESILNREHGGYMKKGGHVRRHGQEYNTGRAWHQDRAKHNSKEKWENREHGGEIEPLERKQSLKNYPKLKI